MQAFVACLAGSIVSTMPARPHTLASFPSADFWPNCCDAANYLMARDARAR